MEDMFIEVREQKKFDDNILDLVYETVIGATQKSVVTEMAADKAREFVLSLPKFTPTEAWGKPESIEREQITKLFNAIGGGRTIEGKLQFLHFVYHYFGIVKSSYRQLQCFLRRFCLRRLVVCPSAGHTGS